MSRSRLYPFHRFLHRLSNWKRWERIKQVRGWHYQGLLAQAGHDLRVAAGVKVTDPDNVRVGDNCYLGENVELYAWGEQITLGNNVLVAAGVRMITRKHGFAEIDIPMGEQGYTQAPITIEDDVWIGFQAIILPGVTVGGGSIVGANAVVTKDVDRYTVVGGVPARLIRARRPLGA